MSEKLIAATVGAAAIAIWVLAYGYAPANGPRAMLIAFTFIGAAVIGRSQSGA